MSHVNKFEEYKQFVEDTARFSSWCYSFGLKALHKEGFAMSNYPTITVSFVDSARRVQPRFWREMGSERNSP
jgi:hypothetical protein